MQVAAVVKFKHGGLWQALKEANWSQSELARRTNMHPSLAGKYCNMQLRPTQERADLMQRVFAEVGIYLDVLEGWPEEFKGLPVSTVSSVADIPLDRLLYAQHHKSLQEHVDPAVPVALDEAMSTLTEREQYVIRATFYDGKSLTTIGKERNLTRERIRQIKDHALKKLRHPVRSDGLKGFIAKSEVHRKRGESE